jgi:hypothetical protein
MKRHAQPKQSFAEYLIDSGVFLLAFIGKSLKFFGIGVVAAFLAGAAGTYAYSRWGTDTLHAKLWPSTDAAKAITETMRVDFDVEDHDGNPVRNGDIYFANPRTQAANLL